MGEFTCVVWSILLDPCKKRHITFTLIVTSFDGIFAWQPNTFLKLLAERPGEKFGIEYLKMAN